MADANLHFQRHANFLVKLQCSVFSSAPLFLVGIKKICQIKVGQNITNMILQTPEVLCRFDQDINVSRPNSRSVMHENKKAPSHRVLTQCDVCYLLVIATDFV